MTASRETTPNQLPTRPEPSPSTVLILVKKVLRVEKKVLRVEKKALQVEKKGAMPTVALDTVEARPQEDASATICARDTETAAVTTNPSVSAKKVDPAERKERLVEKKERLEEKREEPEGALPTSLSRDAVKN
jgi:type IV secretory pathway VirJ component